MLEFAILQKLS